MSSEWKLFCAIEPENYPEGIPAILSCNQGYFFHGQHFRRWCSAYSSPEYRRGLYMYKYSGNIHLAIETGGRWPLGTIISESDKEKLITFTKNLGLSWV